jgi:hypothetical protein
MHIALLLAEDDGSFFPWHSQLKKIRVVSSETDLPLKSCLLAVWRECVVPVTIATFEPDYGWRIKNAHKEFSSLSNSFR